MTVHFIGAGPGAPDLITVRGRDLIARCPVCLYAGSLVPKALIDHCPPGAKIVDTAPLDLDAIIALCVEATAEGKDVARLHSGRSVDLERDGRAIAPAGRGRRADTVTPGVPAFAAAAAALKRELTLPGLDAIAGADAHLRARLAHARAGDAGRIRRDRRDAGDPSVDPGARARGRRASAPLRRRLPGSRRRPRVLAGRADRPRAARRPRRGDARRAHRAQRDHSRRAGARGRRFSRERALQRRLRAAVSRRRAREDD